MKHRFARLTVSALCIALVSVLLGPVAAQGSPVDDKRAEAAQLQRQIDSNGDRIAALGEQYNGALYEYNKATVDIADAQRRFDAAEAQVNSIRDVLTRRASELYKGAGAKSPLDAVNVRSFSEFSTRSKYSSLAADADGTLIGRMRDAQDLLAAQRENLQAQQAKARAQKDAAIAAKRNIEGANTQQKALLGRVKGEIAVLVAQENARRLAAARAAALAAVRPSSSGSSPARGAVPASAVGGNFPDVPVSGGVGAVIAYARAQLGKPYVFATAGPDTFDCSGLTMMAWRQAGVSMAHFSGAQFNAFPHVSLSALQPGDLVFKGPGGRDHVALYIGGGMQIAATHTGDYVRLQPLGTNLTGAVRP